MVGRLNTAPVRPRRVLLVEDHDDTRTLMLRVLTREGYAVVPAAGYREALEAASSSPVDVLVADIRLKDGSGWDLLAHLRQQGHSCGAVAVSGKAYPADIERSLTTGFCEHLTKPVCFDRLLSAIRGCEAPAE